MMRISSKTTFFQKRIFPLIWFGSLAAFSLLALFLDDSGDGTAPPRFLFVVLPLGMAIAGFFAMKRLIWPLMDAVHDGGDYLVVTKGGDEDRIALADIVNVSAVPGRPTYVTLRLRQPGRFGSEVAFLPQTTIRFNPFAKNPIVEELIARIDRARLTASGTTVQH
jgi:hypothetical protein